jgi:hypothetical protein
MPARFVTGIRANQSLRKRACGQHGQQREEKPSHLNTIFKIQMIEAFSGGNLMHDKQPGGHPQPPGMLTPPYAIRSALFVNSVCRQDEKLYLTRQLEQLSSNSSARTAQLEQLYQRNI